MAKADLGDRFLKAEDLLINGEWREWAFEIVATHAENTISAADGKPVDRPIIELKGSKVNKYFVVGKTHKRCLKYEFGTDKASDLVGKKVTLYAALGNWFGVLGPALRVRVTGNKVQPRIKKSILGEDLTGKKLEATA